ncbi:MAG: CPBP family intramembrane metalloprotease, partial [Candidatus Thorarchaeota archaeon]|nr:CPBP family intramembrane metalloprotease [Candidatus Thorarchaeota archaeon]
TIPFQSTLTTSTIIVLALPPIFEELIFRVGVFLAVREVAGTIIAVVTQAGLFALYHFIVWSPDLQYAFVLFFGGIVFQMIFLQSKNILSSMIAHAIVNLRPYLLVILLSPFALLAVGGAIFIVLWRRFRE